MPEGSLQKHEELCYDPAATLKTSECPTFSIEQSQPSDYEPWRTLSIIGQTSRRISTICICQLLNKRLSKQSLQDPILILLFLVVHPVAR